MSIYPGIYLHTTIMVSILDFYRKMLQSHVFGKWLEFTFYLWNFIFSCAFVYHQMRRQDVTCTIERPKVRMMGGLHFVNRAYFHFNIIDINRILEQPVRKVPMSWLDYVAHCIRHKMWPTRQVLDQGCAYLWIVELYSLPTLLSKSARLPTDARWLPGHLSSYCLSLAIPPSRWWWFRQ